jgi:hypothetical protein
MEDISIVPASFAMDPVRSPTIFLHDRHIQRMKPGVNMSTLALDFVIQHVMPPLIRPDLIIGSSNSLPYFVENNNKTLVASSSNSTNSRSIQRMREKYQYYSTKRFQFLAAICSDKHFFAVDVTFDIDDATIF